MERRYGVAEFARERHGVAPDERPSQGAVPSQFGAHEFSVERRQKVVTSNQRALARLGCRSYSGKMSIAKPSVRQDEIFHSPPSFSSTSATRMEDLPVVVPY